MGVLIWMLTAALLIASQAVFTSYIPDLNLRVSHHGVIQPVLVDAKHATFMTEKFGCETLYQWRLSGGLFTLELTKMGFGSQAPKLNVRETATFFHDMMKSTADILVRAGSATAEKTQTEKFSGRQIIEHPLGALIAIVDRHYDRSINTHRQFVAWGDPKFRVLTEMNALNADRLPVALRSYEVAKLSVADAARLPLQTQPIEAMGLSLQLPAVPSLHAVGPQLNAHVRVSDGLDITLISESFIDGRTVPTEAAVRKFRVVESMAGMEPVSNVVAAFDSRPLRGHVLRQRYREFDEPMYGVSAMLSGPGRSLIVHISLSEPAGGKPLAEKMLGSLSLTP